MDRQETIKLLLIRSSMYNIPKNESDAGAEMEIQYWNNALKDIDYKTAYSALAVCINSMHYAPNLSDVLQQIVKNQHPELESPDCSTAYTQVRKAICGNLDYKDLDDVSKLILSESEVKILGRSENISGYLSGKFRDNFNFAYKQISKAKIDYLSQPEKLKNAITDIRMKYLEDSSIAMIGTGDEIYD